MRTDDDPFEAERRQILEIIRRMQDDHQKQLKPYIDRLVRIGSLYPAPRLVIPLEQAMAAGLMPRDS